MEADSELRTALKQWAVNETPSPGFEDAVWRRIAKAERASRLGRLSELLTRVFRRPQMAFACSIALLAFGAGAGYLRADVAKSEARSHFESLYVRSVNPYYLASDRP